MSEYKFKATPNLITPTTEGSLDTSVSNGVSAQRTGYIEVYNGNSRKIVAVNDNEIFDDSMQTIDSSIMIRIDELPEVRTDSVQSEYQLNMTASGTILYEGSSPITEYGWVWSYSESPTISDNKVVSGSESFIGSYTTTSGFGSMEAGVNIYIRAYATNSYGTSYGSQLVGEAFMCFVEGTLVTLADGSRKAIEEIDFNDSLLVWNFDEAKFDTSTPLWICHPFMLPNYRLMKFNNGAELSCASFDKGHRIYNRQKNKFTNLNTEDTPFGTETLLDNGEVATLVDDRLVNEQAMFYNIITYKHINIFANGILTSNSLNNIYPISNMKFIKDNRELRSIEEFDVSDYVFEGLRLAEQPDCDYIKAKAKTLGRSIDRNFSNV